MRALLALMVAFSAGAYASDVPHSPAKGASMKPVTSQELLGTEWLLEDLGGAVVLEGVQATLAFPEPGRVAGKGLCNRFMGSVEFEDGAVRFGKLATTMMACPPHLMQQEASYLKALENAERATMEAAQLVVYSKGAEKPMRFTRMSPKPAS
jgi:heat shock protein HslJ